MFKGITPTFTLTLPEEVDLGVASNVYVTFANRGGKTLVQKKNDDIEINENTVNVYLTQDETLSFPSGSVYVQINWTYIEGGKTKRACSEIASVFWNDSLERGVLE